jgi:hypothetical protein
MDQAILIALPNKLHIGKNSWERSNHESESSEQRDQDCLIDGYLVHVSVGEDGVSGNAKEAPLTTRNGDSSGCFQAFTPTRRWVGSFVFHLLLFGFARSFSNQRSLWDPDYCNSGGNRSGSVGTLTDIVLHHTTDGLPSGCFFASKQSSPDPGRDWESDSLHEANRAMEGSGALS